MARAKLRLAVKALLAIITAFVVTLPVPVAMMLYNQLVIFGLIFVLFREYVRFHYSDRSKLEEIAQGLHDERAGRRYLAVHVLSIVCGSRFNGPLLFESAEGKRRAATYWAKWWECNRDDLVWDELLMRWVNHRELSSVSLVEHGPAVGVIV
jgi:hypothetical protein